MEPIINTLVIAKYFKSCVNHPNCLHYRELQDAVDYLEDLRKTLGYIYMRPLVSLQKVPKVYNQLLNEIGTMTVDLDHLLVNCKILYHYQDQDIDEDYPRFQKRPLIECVQKIVNHSTALNQSYQKILKLVQNYVFGNKDFAFAAGFITAYCKTTIKDEEARIMTFTHSCVAKMFEIIQIPYLSEICGTVDSVICNVDYILLHFLPKENFDTSNTFLDLKKQQEILENEKEKENKI